MNELGVDIVMFPGMPKISILTAPKERGTHVYFEHHFFVPDQALRQWAFERLEELLRVWSADLRLTVERWRREAG